jgi:hypothetical protein
VKVKSEKKMTRDKFPSLARMMHTGIEFRPSSTVGTNNRIGSGDFTTTNEEWSDNPFAQQRASEENVKVASESLTPAGIFERILLFTGVAKPSKWYSAWWMCWVGWRLMLFSQLCYSGLVISDFSSLSARTRWIYVSIICSYGLSALNWYWLPSLWSEAVGSGALKMTFVEAKSSIRLSLLFIGVWLLYSIFVSSVLAPPVGGPLIIIMSFFFSANVAPCGAFLLVLSVDVTLAQIKVKQLVAAARAKKLTRDMYVECSDYVSERSTRWAKILRFVAILAVYSSVSLLIRIGEISDSNSALDLHRLQEGNDVDVFAKEAAVLFMLLFVVFGLNDDADSIVSELVSEPWGEIGSPEDCARVDLLLLSTTYAVRAEGLTSATAFFTARRTRPISFRVCGVRVTRAYFLTVLTSFAIALTNVLVRRISKAP